MTEASIRTSGLPRLSPCRSPERKRITIPAIPMVLRGIPFSNSSKGKCLRNLKMLRRRARSAVSCLPLESGQRKTAPLPSSRNLARSSIRPIFPYSAETYHRQCLSPFPRPSQFRSRCRRMLVQGRWDLAMRNMGRSRIAIVKACFAEAWHSSEVHRSMSLKALLVTLKAAHNDGQVSSGAQWQSSRAVALSRAIRK